MAEAGVSAEPDESARYKVFRKTTGPLSRTEWLQLDLNTKLSKRWAYHAARREGLPCGFDYDTTRHNQLDEPVAARVCKMVLNRKTEQLAALAPSPEPSSAPSPAPEPSAKSKGKRRAVEVDPEPVLADSDGPSKRRKVDEEASIALDFSDWELGPACNYTSEQLIKLKELAAHLDFDAKDVDSDSLLVLRRLLTDILNDPEHSADAEDFRRIVWPQGRFVCFANVSPLILLPQFLL